jgi:hypothetical protein
VLVVSDSGLVVATEGDRDQLTTASDAGLLEDVA